MILMPVPLFVPVFAVQMLSLNHCYKRLFLILKLLPRKQLPTIFHLFLTGTYPVFSNPQKFNECLQRVRCNFLVKVQGGYLIDSSYLIKN